VTRHALLARVVAGGTVLGATAAVVIWLAWLDMSTALDAPIYPPEAPTFFRIEKGETLARIAANLARRGWIEQPLYLEIEARRQGIGGRLQAGLYEIDSGVSIRQILRDFVDGHVASFSVTFVEGTRFVDMRATLALAANLEQQLPSLSDAQVMATFGGDSGHPEGRFFPSTYYYGDGDSDIDVLARAYRQMDEVLTALWNGRDPGLPYKDPFEALTMASIIEKETAGADERDVIAGVFVRRLQRNMKLQTDPTVIYGLGESFDGDLRRRDLDMDTPYNSYTRTGLPPTPIAMPGAASINAALHPADGNGLYFVAKGDGTHHFSASLREHNRAVRMYQLGK
jgi:UPF0755 protein